MTRAFAIMLGAAVLLGGQHAARAQSSSSSARACANAASNGQALRDSGKLVDARAEFVKCAQPSCPKLIQKDCADWQRDVDDRLPQVSVSAADDAGTDLTRVTVTLDGAPFEPGASGRSLAIDPGKHVLRASSPGHRDAEHAFVAREGERARVVRVVLERIVKEEKKKVDDTRRQDTVATPSSGIGPVPIVLGSAGLAGAITFVFLFTGIKSDRDDVVGTPAYTEDKRNELQTRLVIADVIGVASAAALVASGVLVATSLANANRAVSVSAGAVPNGAVTTLRVRF